MGYTQYQKFIATLLLVDVLLQSCGNPNWKLEEAGSSKLGVKTGSLKASPGFSNSQFPKPSKRSENPVVADASISYCGESSAGVAHEVCANRWGTSSPSPAHGVPHTTTLQHAPIGQSPRFLSPAIATRPLGHTQVSAQSTAKSLQHVVCDEGSLARYKSSQHATSWVVTPSAPPRNAAPIRSVASLVVTKSTSSTLSQSLSLKSETKAVAALGTFMSPFALSSGQEVVFGRVSDHWQARVRDMWGTFFRETTLPVVCKGDLSAMLHNLQGKGAVHKQRLIHILKTDQLPWAPSVVYVGAMGLRGGMEKEARQAQEQTNTVHASGKIDRVAVSGLQPHETSDKEQEDAARQAEKRRISSEPRRQKILANAASRLAYIKEDCPVDHDHKKRTQGVAKEQDAQSLTPNKSITAWHPPFVARAAPTPVLSHFLPDHLRLCAQSVSEALLLGHTPAACEPVPRAQLGKGVKLPSLPRVTALSTLEEVRSAVETYLERWSLETPSGRESSGNKAKTSLKS